MPRIPTTEEAQSLAESLLSDLLEKAFPGTDGMAFCDGLERQIKATLNVPQRISIARIVANCRVRGENVLEVSDLREAKRLVKSTRREIGAMQELVKNAASGDINGSNTAIAVRRQIWGAYQDATYQHKQLSLLTDLSDPHERLAEAETIVYEALQLVDPPFFFSDFEGAVALLDALLNDWPISTRSMKGQRWCHKVVNDGIAQLAQVYEDATGRSAKAKNRFKPFVDSVLSGLPADIYPPMGEHALTMRLKRLQRSKRK